MKANELRRGNLVDFNGTNAKILEIRQNHARIEYTRSDTGLRYSALVDYDRLNPIILDCEWLVRFGAIIKKDAILFEGIHLYRKNKEIYFLSENNGRNHLEIKTVHQLQNLYRYLIGVELEIN